MTSSTIPQRLSALRQHLSQQGWQACLVPSSDPHLSEYLPDRWQTREWLSGFTGSSGTLIVAEQQAALFTDSRYWEQAEAELAGSGIALFKLEGAAVPAYVGWLKALNVMTPQAQLAVDGAVLGLALTQSLSDALAQENWTLVTAQDPVDAIWPDRPAPPLVPVFEHTLPHASTSRADKLAALRQALVDKGATHHWIATLDDLAWVLNLRGADVDYNPVFVGHALISLDSATLFVAPPKVSADIQARLVADGVQCQPYDQALPALRALPPDARLLIDPKRITWGLREAVPASVAVIESINPTTLAKSRKTNAEAAFVREAMERDGAAMCAFYAWFESALGHEHVSELTVDERLTAERVKQPDFVSLSFPTIAGFNANGALPHYRATPDSFAVLSTPQGLAAHGLLLIDSGAQYLGGTTDITRVWAIGTPTKAQQRDFTLVLKGTLALSRARYPRGTLSPMLDAIARGPLWAEGIDFGHGTGHGVGYFLNVHEGPQSISKAVPEAHMAMHPGMITSIEPGLYRPKQWGIRIENLVINVSVAPSVANTAPGDPEHGEYLAFETLSLCPIDTRCIDLSLLRADEVEWLNNYHAQVLKRLRPLVSGAALAWLETRTQPI
ncbi:MAG: aminopeptidase P family protein [Aquabacterium sp.]|uniref:aminopeptidase P family protein n=1 Tax=Aquabacterium sp. TaxID=1872578 RepID=UPI00272668A3|nr:aminopeptidase P family protein [Aquabacterium sp.]MDO9004558.1 aminopeptidase P family protein [Aquabacterium sp.]